MNRSIILAILWALLLLSPSVALAQETVEFPMVTKGIENVNVPDGVPSGYSFSAIVREDSDAAFNMYALITLTFADSMLGVPITDVERRLFGVPEYAQWQEAHTGKQGNRILLSE